MNEKLLKQILFEQKKTNELLQVIATNKEQKIMNTLLEVIANRIGRIKNFNNNSKNELLKEIENLSNERTLLERKVLEAEKSSLLANEKLTRARVSISNKFGI